VTTMMILGPRRLENQSPGIGGESGGCRRCVAQWAFGRPIQKMLRWRPLIARGPLSGVRPHTQVRRVYEGKGKRKAKKWALVWKEWPVRQRLWWSAWLEPASSLVRIG